MPSANSSELATFITSGVARMSALIDDMLSFATTGAQPLPGPVNLEAAVSLATQDLQPEMLRTAASVVVGCLPTVMGVEIQFVRIFQNLIANAIKYRVTSGSRSRSPLSARPRSALSQSGTTVWASVSSIRQESSCPSSGLGTPTRPGAVSASL